MFWVRFDWCEQAVVSVRVKIVRRGRRIFGILKLEKMIDYLIRRMNVNHGFSLDY